MALDRVRAINVAAAAKESAYGTAATIDRLLRVNTGSIPNLAVQTINDQDKIGGEEEITDVDVIAKSGSFDMGINRVKPDGLAFVAGFGMGAVATAAADTGTPATVVEQHAITPMVSDAQISFTFEGVTTASIKKLYKGGLINSFTLRVNRGANRFINLNANVLFDGTEGTAGSAQTEKAESPLNAAATTGVFIGTAPASGMETAGNRSQDLDPASSDLAATPTNISSTLRSLEWTFNNNINPDDLYLIGGGLTFGKGERTARTQQVTLTFDYTDQTEVDRLLNQTDVALELIVRGDESSTDSGYYHGAHLILPKLRWADVRVAEEGGRLVNQITADVLQDATFGSAILDVFNEQAAYAA